MLESTGPNVDYSDAIRRDIPRYKGIYILGSVQGEEVNFTVDTGASKSILSERVYAAIPEDKRPRLVAASSKEKLANADGRQMKCYGKALFAVELGSLKLEKWFTVVEIQDEVLLGADILWEDSYGPADIMLSEDKIVLRGTDIPIENLGGYSQSRRVTAADHYIVPGRTEMIIDAFVENSCEPNRGNTCLLFEPNENLARYYKIVVAPCVLNALKAQQ